MKNKTCDITGQSLPLSQLAKGTSIRQKLFTLIKSEHATFSEDSYISLEELNKYRTKYIKSVLEDEIGELSTLEKDVLHSINQNELLSENIEPEIEGKLTIGEKLSDKIAAFGGSWTFIITFFSILIIWIAINSVILLTKVFDPYPFILLNLILSCLAAIQAPIIMMSQNRQEEKDRRRSEHDYKINLKAELEIRLLHEKMDHLILQQNQRLLEIQEIQIDLMGDILTKIK